MSGGAFGTPTLLFLTRDTRDKPANTACETSRVVAAGRLLGSDVLGGDDEISRDHDWGPQFDLFLTAEADATF